MPRLRLAVKRSGRKRVGKKKTPHLVNTASQSEIAWEDWQSLPLVSPRRPRFKMQARQNRQPDGPDSDGSIPSHSVMLRERSIQ
jgi:hypothetical protein